MSHFRIEICCGSVRDAALAGAYGAEQIELNSALALGGLSPSLGTLEASRAAYKGELICMLRHRAGGFAYAADEFQTLLTDARLLLEHGADGLAFGFLSPACEVQKEQTQELIDLVHSYAAKAVFHRAIDCCRDYLASVDLLYSLGIDRILSSGQAERAMDGVQLLREAQARVPIDLVAASGINASNVRAVVEASSVRCIHASLRGSYLDPTTKLFSYLTGDEIDCLDEAKLAALCKER